MNGAVEGGPRLRRLTALYDFGPASAALEEVRNNVLKKKLMQPVTASPSKGPSSLFILSEDNFVRKHVKMLIEWLYPFNLNRPISNWISTINLFLLIITN